MSNSETNESVPIATTTSTTLITGGAGFIGSHLAEHLKAQGRRLVLVDNLSTGNRANVEALLDERCMLVEANVSDALRDPALLQGVTEIYHLAAAVGVMLVVDDPTAMVRNNIDETAVVLDAAVRCEARVLIASSSEVYGKCPVLPVREDMDLVYGPTTASRWSYGLSKALDEHLALDAHRRRGAGVVIARLFNTIGPRQVGRYGMVVPRFVQRAVRGEPIEVFGNGEQTRAFCDVRDVVRAMTALLSEPACLGQIYNLGSERQVTINELAARVNALAGGGSAIEHVPYERVYGKDFEDTPDRLPDTSKIRTAIGWQPAYALEQTLAELVESARRNHPDLRSQTRSSPA
ncbi:MAG: NAD-dependent epimerase/dehydratase family protein [Phycisphaeraceae bacterium]